VLFLLLLMCFLAQVWEHVNKYLSKATTQSTKFKKLPKLTFPELTLCVTKGFKIDRMKELGLPSNYWLPYKLTENLWPVPNSTQEIDAWWKYTTYSKEELIVYMMAYSNDRIEYLNETDVVSVSSDKLGNCLSVNSQQNIESTAGFWEMQFKVPSNDNSFQVLFTSRGLGFTAIRAFPMGSVRTFELRAGDLLTISVTKTISVTTNEDKNCRENVEQCLFKEADKQIPCYFPSMRPWSTGKPMCKSLKEADQRNFARSIINVMESAVCGVQCTKEHYDYEHITLPLPNHANFKNRAGLMMFYSTTNVQEVKEVYLYDFNSILSSVGGSLGLFLGFSCFGTILTLAHCLYAYVMKCSRSAKMLTTHR